ncbi:bifunctional protein-serine/threonine kinase/phosphatase [Noviherbaspirillum sp. 17J57-3]|uniref:Bifunctional protein-serine/threonine kinase/phosphatase n=2 Tax=Noviherbaspirillum galbum TaxID=2709383 RepID=A0A6B3SMG9_9BURK|nr:bifunctional protein-serine/threonine kinase/phosphatase [Noviherbaspirillum galbum]
MSQLTITIGQHSEKGRKTANQDFHGACVPGEPQLSSKGIVAAVADGISSSAVSHIASQQAVASVLEDYYCTSDAWSVKTSVERVIAATNSWLHAQTQQSQYRFDMDRGYVCTLSAMVVKSTTAHLFHVGDSRIYQLRGAALEQLTNDHRIHVSSAQSYLARALGMNQRVEIDYHAIQLEAGDTFLLATDGVYDYIDGELVARLLETSGSNLDMAAQGIVEHALRRGSADNLTVQIVRVDALPQPEAGELVQQMSLLPFPPALEPRMEFDGFRIVRQIHASSRSHVFLAVDIESGEQVALKTPSTEMRDDPDYLERFLLEEWIARRINSPHVLKPCQGNRSRNYLYVAMEYIEGETLAQWMRDHPAPGIDAVRGVIEQVGRGLRAFHRMEMVHQDLRPENIMVDRTGTARIIDFGATRVAGISEGGAAIDHDRVVGTLQYTAPECFHGEQGDARSDMFSLAVIAYQMLSGTQPYGVEVAKIRSAAEARKLSYRSLLESGPGFPLWVDEALRRALHPVREKRYGDLAEFIHDLRHPNKAYLRKTRPPLIERNPVIFWKVVAMLLFLVTIGLLATRPAGC